MDRIAHIRKDYRLRSFSEEDAAANPFEQFRKWSEESIAAEIEEPNAMTLATADAKGLPSARIVLLKGMSTEGFEFFTNYESHKAKDMAENNHVALVFFWKELERQIRIEGTVVKTTDQISDDYFKSRPFESRIGAWASQQTEVISSRAALEEKVSAMHKKFEGNTVPRPPFWGGYLVKPVMMEFWQGRPNRLHDRIAYGFVNGIWEKNRLAP